MKFTDILLEYNRDQTVKNYGEKILAAALTDRSVPWLDVFADSTNPRKVHELIRTPEGQQTAINYIMGVIEQADPTKNKNYSQAISRLYAMGGTLLEDIQSTLSQYLIKFDKLNKKKKIQPPYNDFMRYKSLNDFMTAVEAMPDPDSDVEQQKVAEINLPPADTWRYIHGQIDQQGRILTDCLVIQPLDKYSAYWWAKEYPKKGVTNRWCTAWEGENSRFDYYNKQGPLYIIIPAKRGFDDEKFQFHFETKQFMDYQDHQLGTQGINDLAQRFPVLTQIFARQAAKFSVLGLMSPEYKAAVKEHAKVAAPELAKLITEKVSNIANPNVKGSSVGFAALADYGITLDPQVKAELVRLIEPYLLEARDALVAKDGFWSKVVNNLGSERSEDRLEVFLNTDSNLRSLSENSAAGAMIQEIVKNDPSISQKIDATHMQDLLLRDPLFRVVMKMVPRMYSELLEKLAPVNESTEWEDDNEPEQQGFFVCIGSEDDGGFVGMITKDGGKWRESTIAGNPPYKWGGSYMSYLTPDDVMQHIRNDYSRGYDIKGPFFDEDKAMNYAQVHYGLGDDQFDDEFDDEFDDLDENRYSSYNNNRTGFRKPVRDLSDEGEPEGIFTVMIDGRPWKTATSNEAFRMASNVARKYPNKQVQVKWPNGALNTVKEGSLTEFAPSVATGGGKKDYGQPNSSRYLGGNKFIVGTTNNYILTATIDKYGLDWDDGWYLDSPGAAHLSDASEGEIPLPISSEQRHSLHDLVTDYLNDRNQAELQKVATYFGHSDDGDMNEQAVAEGFKSKQEMIAHFVATGRTAAQGAAAWERTQGKTGTKKKPNPFDPNYKFKPVDNRRYGEKELDEDDWHSPEVGDAWHGTGNDPKDAWHGASSSGPMVEAKSKPLIRKVERVRADDSIETTYELLDINGRTLKTGMSRETALSALKAYKAKQGVKEGKKQFNANNKQDFAKLMAISESIKGKKR